MMAAWKRKQSEKDNKDQGSALVLVVIAIAFVGALVAMLVYLVYFNYLMKFADRSAKNNFYTAETALDVIKAGLEQDVSDAMVISYYEVANNHASDSALNKQAAFEDEFRNNLNTICGIEVANIGPTATSQSVYNPANMAAYWQRITQLNQPGYDGFAVAANAGDEGARMEVFKWDSGQYPNLGTNEGMTNLINNGPIVVYNGSVVEFRNVRVSYTDQDGYVSIIKTDITVEAPKINFGNVLNIPDLETYSIVAADGVYNGYERNAVTFEPTPTSGVNARTEVTGNVFGGEDGIYVNGINAQIAFKKADSDPDTRRYTVTANSFNAIAGRSQTAANRPADQASLTADEFYEVWAGDLYVESATLDIDANCFVQDDLTIDGTYSGVTLSGIYNGYGTAIASAKGNSSILINGAHTTLDFSNLQQLNLAGHAYVGSIHYNANENDSVMGDYIKDPDAYRQAHADDGDDPNRVQANTNNDVLMGQSVAVKSDQLMYMVPVECMGYDGDTQVLAKNPMTYSEYEQLANTFVETVDSNGNTVQSNKYTLVRLDVVMNKVGGSLNSYGASYVPVFRRVSNDILVYFYMSFTSDDKANEFFRDYYNADRTSFDRYLNTYIANYTIPSRITDEGSGNLSIAGNMLYKRGNTVYMRQDTFEADLEHYEDMERDRTLNATYYQNLTKYLMKTNDDLPASQLQNNVFVNLTVSQTDFDNQVSPGTYRTYQNTAGDTVALVVNNVNRGVFTFDSSIAGVDSSKVHLIIATGDVAVNVRNFEGLIFVGGDIYIGSVNEHIDYNASEVQKAMVAKNADSHYVFEVIENGIAYANSLGTTDADLLAAIEAQREEDIVRSSDLVKFVNWNKE